MFLGLANLLSTVSNRMSLIYPQLVFFPQLFRGMLVIVFQNSVHFVGFLVYHHIFYLRNITTNQIKLGSLKCSRICKGSAKLLPL